MKLIISNKPNKLIYLLTTANNHAQNKINVTFYLSFANSVANPVSCEDFIRVSGHISLGMAVGTNK